MLLQIAYVRNKVLPPLQDVGYEWLGEMHPTYESVPDTLVILMFVIVGGLLLACPLALAGRFMWSTELLGRTPRPVTFVLALKR